MNKYKFDTVRLGRRVIFKFSIIKISNTGIIKGIKLLVIISCLASYLKYILIILSFYDYNNYKILL